MPLPLHLHRERDSLSVSLSLRWGPKCQQRLCLLPGCCWASYHSGTPATRTSILGEGQVWQSFQVSQRKFSITFVSSKVFKFQKEIVKSLLLCFSKIGRISSGTEQRASPVHPKNDLCHDRSFLPCLETPGRRGSNSVSCSHTIPCSSPLIPALTRGAWPFLAQATGAENEGRASTERK